MDQVTKYFYIPSHKPAASAAPAGATFFTKKVSSGSGLFSLASSSFVSKSLQ